MKNVRDYHDLYFQSDTLLLCDIFKSFRDMCLKAFDLDTPHFHSAPEFVWIVKLKTAKIRMEVVTDANMLLMIETRSKSWILSNNT